jgi:hypothetical protein
MENQTEETDKIAALVKQARAASVRAKRAKRRFRLYDQLADVIEAQRRETEVLLELLFPVSEWLHKKGSPE